MNAVDETTSPSPSSRLVGGDVLGVFVSVSLRSDAGVLSATVGPFPAMGSLSSVSEHVSESVSCSCIVVS